MTPRSAPPATLTSLADALASGRTTSRNLVEDSLARIADPKGEGSLAFLQVDAEGARAAANLQDKLRARGHAPSPWAGIPFSVKDLFDLAGEVTTAGSKLLQGAPPATRDAPAIAALKSAGLVVLGRTNMTEFAYSGLGLNPHYGTPASVWDRGQRRIPGGSSSGAAVSVADQICPLAIGSDTGGSCRVPAAYNGLVGFKPTVGRISTEGVYPLSPQFDSIGPLARSVACCAVADSLMAGAHPSALIPRGLSGLKLGLLTTLVLDELDAEVAVDLERAVRTLTDAGGEVVDLPWPELADMPSLIANGGIVGAEGAAFHREQMAARGDDYDPHVRSRIQLAESLSAADYLRVTARRRRMIARFAELSRGFDALILPTTPILPPRIADLSGSEPYRHYNGLSLRNTYLANFLGGCAISLPMHRPGAAPTGLMLMAPGGADPDLLATAAGVEAALAGRV